MNEIALLKTKFYVPAVESELVRRPRLVEQLNDALRRKLRLVVLAATAGFGKTTLVAEWLAQLNTQSGGAGALPSQAPAAYAWLSLDETDDDPVRFWTYVVAAFQSIIPDVGGTSLELLRTVAAPAPETFLVPLLNELAATDGHMILVLDDYHTIAAQPIHDALAFLLDHLPPNVLLVLNTRSDPPLPLGRLRARGKLLELRAADLRFTAEEAAEFLNRVMGLNLTAPQVRALEGRTEGWVAGLQLAALSMRGQRDVSGFITAFTGSHRYVMDYLVDEVLSRQEPALESFLLQTSILDRLNADLCNAVTLTGESARHLDFLERANLFLVPLDSAHEWFRYHHLFAELLRHRLATMPGARVEELHRRAAVWLAEHSWATEAVSHALTAHDSALAADLIASQANAMFLRGEHGTLNGWLDQLPRSELLTRPALALAYAQALVVAHKLREAQEYADAVQAWLDRVEANGAETRKPVDVETVKKNLLLVRIRILSRQNEWEKLIEIGEASRRLFRGDEYHARGLLLNNLGVAYLYADREQEALQAFTEGYQASVEGHDWYVALFALSNRADIYMLAGQLAKADEIYTEGSRLAGMHYLGETLPACRLLLSRADIYHVRNEMDCVEQAVNEALEISKRHPDPYYRVLSLTAQARLCLVRGQVEQAGKLAAEARAHAEAHRIPESSLVEAAEFQTQYWLQLDNVAAAVHWAETSSFFALDELTTFRIRWFMLLARIWTRGGRLKEALALLARLRAYAKGRSQNFALVEGTALEALALELSGASEQAERMVGEALNLAAPERFIRTFVDKGEPMRQLLDRFRTRGRRSRPSDARTLAQLGFCETVLAAFPGGAGVATRPPAPVQAKVGPDALTARELQVLRLIAEGATNREIADELVITIATVKKHSGLIFGKLGVSNRTEAVARAREMGLLTLAGLMIVANSF